MLTNDRDEELSLFLEMRRREKELRAESLLTGSDNISINGALTTAVSEALSGRYPLRRTAAENFLYSENEKSDYDWLLTPPGTPQFEKESHRSVMNQVDGRPTVLKSRLGNCGGEEMISGNNNNPQMSSYSGPSSVAGLRRPSSSCSSRSTSRPSTPTSRSTSRPSTPTRRSTTTTTSTTRPVTTRASTSRSSTPTSRATLTASRATTSTAAPRTTTSTGQARSATPTRCKTQPSSAPSKKLLSRQATPTRRPSTPTGPSIVVSKAPSGGTSPAPTLKSSRPQKPPEMPGFSLEAPPNLRTTLSDGPALAARGRPGVASAPGSRSSSIERGSGGPTGVVHARRQSCSPSRRQAPIGNANGSLPGARGRGGKTNNGGSSYDSFSPVAMGNKMVERVVNMRKLGPPRLTENGGRGTVKSNSAFNSLGYGRNLSKSSIDMALRHMDIRRGMTGSLRPLVTKVPASSMYSVRSRSTSVTNSPVATSSTVSSSELSHVDNINILCLDGNDAENDDLLSERSFSSPRNQFPKFTS
ncbi:hypothetical protein HA466_0189410 [Hirschfeldia incana]|nr:hypothetical protein HA466_0189410 [Hirschfeldia incana]